jgi:hypothetical protein
MTPQARIIGIRELETKEFGHVPQRHLEIDWLYATCLYELFDCSILSDARWDQLTAHLWKFKGRLTPYFKGCVPLDCLQSSTGSGIDWDAENSIPAMVKAGCEELLPFLM